MRISWFKIEFYFQIELKIETTTKPQLVEREKEKTLNSSSMSGPEEDISWVLIWERYFWSINLEKVFLEFG